MNDRVLSECRRQKALVSLKRSGVVHSIRIAVEASIDSNKGATSLPYPRALGSVTDSSSTQSVVRHNAFNEKPAGTGGESVEASES